MSVTIYVVHDTRWTKKNSGLYPIKMRVTFERKYRDFQTIYELSSEDWQKLPAPRVNSQLQEIREKLKELERTSGEFASQLDPFTFSDFEKGFILNHPLFKQRKRHKLLTPPALDKFDYTPYLKRFSLLEEGNVPIGTIAASFCSYIKKLLQEERIGTAINYHCSYQSLKKFKGNILITDVTPSFLRQFELWMLNAENSKTTIGMYLRPLRAVINEAIEDGIFKREKYPFGRRKYIIPAGKNIKKALKLPHISKIYYYEPSSKSEAKARDFWMLFYLANGINPKDVALLKYKNINGKFISFERAKTERTARKDPKPISIYITEEITQIINCWGNQNKIPNNYIFPILEPKMSPLAKYESIQNFVKFVNKWMSIICGNLKFDKEVKTIVARHSFATILKNSGASTEFIQESLGHTHKETTENYLDSFEDEIKIENAKKLTAFKLTPL